MLDLTNPMVGDSLSDAHPAGWTWPGGTAIVASTAHQTTFEHLSALARRTPAENRMTVLLGFLYDQPDEHFATGGEIDPSMIRVLALQRFLQDFEKAEANLRQALSP